MAKSKPMHSILRQKFQGYFFKFLNLVLPSKNSKEIIKDEIQSILIVRINYRIGNLLFVTPIIQQLQKEFPNAKIDLLIGAGFVKPLFEGFENVQTIYDMPRKLLKNPIEFYKYIKQLRSKKYDVTINVNYGSSSDKVATLLSKAKYKVGFCQEASYSPATHCVEKKDGIKHASLKPLELLKAFGKKPDYSLRMDIALSKEEKEEAKKILEKLLPKNNSKKVISIFRNARWEKKLEDSWWRELVDGLNKTNEYVIIDILSPDIKEALSDGIITYEEKNLRKLGAFLSNLEGFICADTGPMHLASASKVPTIALFKDSDIDSYAPIGEKDTYLDIKNKEVKDVVKEINLFLNK
jgi:ADP-heptose:LPS heptosyltransferase